MKKLYYKKQNDEIYFKMDFHKFATFEQYDNVGKHGPGVQSIFSLTSSLRGQLVKCLMTI